MAIIYSYPPETNPQPTDLLVGTSTVTVDGTQTNVTRSYSMQTITDYIKTLGGIGVESITFTAPLTGGTITKDGTVSIPQATSLADGYLSSTDWNVFNSKLGGATGVQDAITMWTSTAAIGSSAISQPGGGTTITVGKHLIPLTNATYDLGVTATQEWRNMYLSGTSDINALVIATSINANGSEGTSGQILTSGGPGAAMTWTTTSTFSDLYTLNASTNGSDVDLNLDASTTTDSTVKFTAGTGLTGGGTSGAVTLTGTGLTITQSGGNDITFAPDTAVVTNGATTLSTGNQIYDFVTTLPLNDLGNPTGSIDANSQQITNLGTTSLSSDAATKAYVDAAVANVGTFQGGYNAATNTPDLDVSPSTSIQNGWFWAVTTPGTFFTIVVQNGDLIFANTDNPGAVEGNWTVVDSGHDTATTTTLGVAKFPTGNNGLDITAGAVTAQVFSGANLTGGYVPDASTETGEKFLKRDGTWAAGPVTNVSSITIDAGLTGVSNPITSTGNIGPDYTTAANIIKSAPAGSALGDTDTFIVSQTNAVIEDTLANLKAYIGVGGPGTGTQYTLPVWATTSTLGDSMLSQNAGGTLLTNNGSFTTTSITDSAASTGTAGQVLTAGPGGGAVTWGAAAASYTSWDLTGDSGTPQSIGDTQSATISSANTAITTSAGLTRKLTITSTAFGGGATIGHVPDASGGTDTTKFLKGDGTWADAGGGSLIKDEFTATSSQTLFVVSQAPADINYVSVYVAGVYQTKSAIASVSGTDVTLASGVPTGTKVEMVTTY